MKSTSMCSRTLGHCSNEIIGCGFTTHSLTLINDPISNAHLSRAKEHRIQDLPTNQRKRLHWIYHFCLPEWLFIPRSAILSCKPLGAFPARRITVRRQPANTAERSSAYPFLFPPSHSRHNSRLLRTGTLRFVEVLREPTAFPLFWKFQFN